MVNRSFLVIGLFVAFTGTAILTLPQLSQEDNNQSAKYMNCKFLVEKAGLETDPDTLTIPGQNDLTSELNLLRGFGLAVKASAKRDEPCAFRPRANFSITRDGTLFTTHIILPYRLLGSDLPVKINSNPSVTGISTSLRSDSSTQYRHVLKMDLQEFKFSGTSVLSNEVLIVPSGTNNIILKNFTSSQ